MAIGFKLGKELPLTRAPNVEDLPLAWTQHGQCGEGCTDEGSDCRLKVLAGTLSVQLAYAFRSTEATGDGQCDLAGQTLRLVGVACHPLRVNRQSARLRELTVEKPTLVEEIDAHATASCPRLSALRAEAIAMPTARATGGGNALPT